MLTQQQMGQSNELVFLEDCQTPFGRLPVYKMTVQPYDNLLQYSFSFGSQSPDSMERQLNRLRQYKNLQHQSLCRIHKILDSRDHLIQCGLKSIRILCLYLPVSLRQWLKLYRRRLEPLQIVAAMADLLELGELLCSRSVVSVGQLNLDELFVDGEGTLKLYPFQNKWIKRDILPEPESLGLYNFAENKEVLPSAFVWRAGMLALQLGLQLDYQTIFFDQKRGEIIYEYIEQSLAEFEQQYEKLGPLVRKMLRKRERIQLSRCKEAWRNLRKLGGEEEQEGLCLVPKKDRIIEQYTSMLIMNKPK